MKAQFILAVFALAISVQAGGGGGGAPARRSLGLTQLPREWLAGNENAAAAQPAIDHDATKNDEKE